MKCVEKFSLSYIFQIYNFISNFDNYDGVNEAKFVIWKFSKLVKITLKLGLIQEKDFFLTEEEI